MDEGWLGRLLSDPPRLRRLARRAGAALAPVSGLSYLALGDGLLALVYGLTWLALPVVAGLAGCGGAFFVQHGVGVRRMSLELAAGVLGLLGACVSLSTIAGDGGVARQLLAVALASALYFAVFLGLAAAVALALGRGLDYAGRRIDELDDEGW
jgi:hypothetical protein